LLLRRQILLNPRLKQIDKNLVLPKACSRHNAIYNTASVEVTAQKILPFLIEPRGFVGHLLFTLFGRGVKVWPVWPCRTRNSGDLNLRFFERATIVVLAVLLVAALVRYLGNDIERVAASNAVSGGHYLFSNSAPTLATHTQ